LLSQLKFNTVLDGKTGLLKSVVMDEVELPISQNFYYYKGYIGDNEEFANRSSGAYIFRPNGSQALLVSATPKTISYKGK
jgi:lysosomal alpha-mannosidase